MSFTERVTAVLREHQDYANDDDSAGILCAGCFARIEPDGDSHAGFLAGLAAHQAAALFALIQEAQAEALRSAAEELDLPGSDATGYYSGNDQAGYAEAERHVET